MQVNQRFAERGRRGRRRGRHRLGARLPAAAGAGDAARAAARPADRLLPAHPVPAGRAVHRSCRGAGRSSRACSAPTWSASSCPAAPQNFVRLVRQRVGHKTHRDLVYLPDGRTVRAARLPDLDRRRRASRSWPAPPRCVAAGRGDPRGARATRSKILLGVDRLDYTKGIGVRLRGLRASCSRTARSSVEDAVLRAGRDARAGSGSSSTAQLRDDDRAAGRPDQRRPTAGSAGRRSTTCTTSLPARGDGRALPGRRRHGRDAAARRHEPGRQGVRRLPRTTTAARWCSREFAGAADELRQACWSTPTTSTA